jgi:hypothetical protein
VKNSGKQILLSILSELSTKIINDNDLAYESKRLKAALLCHGGTSEDTFELLKSIQWGKDEVNGELIRQGIVVGIDKIFLSDLFEDIWKMPKVAENIQKKYPEMSERDMESSFLVMWLIFSSVQMFHELIEVEKQDVDLNDKIKLMIDKIEFFEK